MRPVSRAASAGWARFRLAPGWAGRWQRTLPALGELGFAFSMDTTSWSSGGLEPFLNLAIVCLLENLDPLHIHRVNQYAIELRKLHHGGFASGSAPSSGGSASTSQAGICM